MKKIAHFLQIGELCPKKLWLALKIFTLLLFITSRLSAQKNGQDSISLNLKNVSLIEAFKAIEKKSAYRFYYSNDIVPANKQVSISIVNAQLEQIMEKILAGTGLGWKSMDKKMVVITVVGESGSPKDPTIIGSVKNPESQPLQGATVTEKGTSNAVSTDENGNFKISVQNDKSVLVISYVGMYIKEVLVGNQAFIDVPLVSIVTDMDDVVVVGYGIQKKVTNTGAQSSMTGKLLVQSPAANISNSLVGRLPGLFASQASGEPGNDQSTLRIRGVGTFNGSQDPLVLVDGIQVDNYNNIDPNEIANITILKDASSTAVYGIRGANGVLIITTKRGVAGPAKVSYTFNEAINSFTAIRSQMNSADYSASFNKALEGDSYISGSVYTPRYSDADIAKYRSGEDPIFYPSTDWFKLILKKTSTQQQHNLNISGGTDKVRYAISLGTFSQSGLFNNTNLSPDYDAQLKFRRYNFRSNLNFTITSRFRAAIDISSQTENRTGNATNTRTVIDFINSGNPTLGPGILDGKLVQIKSGEGTPIQLLYQDGYKRDYRNFLNGSVRLDHDLDFITKGLTTHAIISYQNFNNQVFSNSKLGGANAIIYLLLRLQSGEVAFLPQAVDAQYSYSEAINKNRRTTAEFAVDYKRKFGDHNVSALLLYNQQKTINPGFAFLVPSGYQSVVGRATYDYKSRYLAEINIAYNGTENFAPGNRFGLFPAYSLGWVASDESFFPKNAVLTFLKFRGSYGEVGNDQIGSDFLTSNNRFLYRPTAWLFSGGSRFGEVGSTYNQLGGVVEGRSSNPNLTWERAVKTNLGVEMSFWDRKITLTVDLFKEIRDNILANKQTIPGIVGVNIPPENLGKMQNKGFEVDLGLNNNIGKFNYQVKANYSFARNKILFQDEIPPTYPYQSRTGTRYGQYFGLVDEGLFNTWDEVNDPKRPLYEWNNNKIQPGDIRFKDVNGDGKINDFDQVAIGYSNIPEITYGLSLSGEYKGVSLSVLFQGVGNVSLNYTRRYNQAFFDISPAGAVDYLIESWTPERYAAGLPINFPRFSVGNGTGTQNNYRPSTFFLADASYLRLKNIELGYNITTRTLKKIGFNSARVFVNANNLFTWSKVYKGADPESPPTAVNAEQYPLVKTINTGVNINF